MADVKNLRPTREAVSLLRLFVGNPYDVTTAINWLGSESHLRDLRVSEIRYALSKLSADRLVPHCTPGARRIVKTLLAVDEPLSTTELAEAADIARSTIARGGEAAGDRLQALGLIEHTDDGKWRIPIAFNNDAERYDKIMPSAVEATDQLAVRDVFYEAALQIIDDPARWGDPDDPVCGCWINLTDEGIPDIRPLLSHWEWLKPWVSVFEEVLDELSMLATVDDDSQHETVVSFGASTAKTTVQAPLPHTRTTC
jgi:hypothetical protein